ncbi:CHAD domain-containing protein [Trichlorobacter thiogenes]|uniref:CHAD domain-containing protein n=1 Tax=Trichlorobacter thiogenes TaxID=115783 RepID=A0A1T4MF91_9BACT|nr:CHAD domain-containing protein [Trichlorobacter thiogenes]SJZ65434.1 CHAD domain-containing protein [Trichlorobacter thiogenes]
MSLSNSPHRTVQPPLPGSRQLLEAFAACLTSRWDDLLQLRHQTLNCFDVEHIHDLRVASRRLRGAVEQLGPFIGTERMDRLRRPIRRLTRELGLVRNLDETLLYLEKTGEQGLEPLLASLGQQRKQEAAQARRLLETLDCMKLERQLRAAATALVTPDNIASQGLLALLSERNLALYYPIHALLPLVAAPEMVEERHALRIAVKKWRYFTELLHAILGGKQQVLLDQLRQYQSVLGDMNDRVVIAALLQGAADLPEPVREKQLKNIAKEQRKLLKKLCDLLIANPIAYCFEL